MKIQAIDSLCTELKKGDAVTFHNLSGLHGTGHVIKEWSNGTISVRHSVSGAIHKLAGSLVTKVWQ